MEESENYANKSQSEAPKEKVRIELEAPADELIIKRESVDTTSQKSEETEEVTKKADRQKGIEEIEKELEEKKQKNEEKESIGEKEIGGYKLGDLAKAPVEPPEPGSDEPSLYNKTIVITGSIVALIGLVIIWPLISAGAAIAVMLIGAAIITAGVVAKV